MGKLVVVIFGLMGTGKTTLARRLGLARGWPVVHSDAVRKALAGLAPTTPIREKFGQGIYDEGFSARTYTEMRRLAGEHLAAGGAGVILDASFKSARERQLARELAREHDAGAAFILCRCPVETVRERLTRREAEISISDGRLDILDLQARDFEPPTPADRPLLSLDTARELDEVCGEAEAFLAGLERQSHPLRSGRE